MRSEETIELAVSLAPDGPQCALFVSQFYERPLGLKLEVTWKDEHAFQRVE